MSFLEQIEREVESGYINVAKHPTKPLTIYNYSKKAQFENHWNETTRKCRGLVLDDLGNTIIECIPKFFNLGEPLAPKQEDILKHPFVVSEKLDGYYISFKIDKKYGMIITSRGSFTSKYALAAQKYLTKEIIPNLKEGYTYFCELCENFEGDESIIVAHHDTPRLVCWAIKDCDNNEVLTAESPLPIAKNLSYEDAKKYLQGNVEGVVVQDLVTRERVKVKTEWYLTIHRAISDCTKKRVWEVIVAHKKVEDLSIPDEFMPQMLTWEKELQEAIESDYQKALDIYSKTENLSDREFANSSYEKYFKTLVFCLRKDQEQRALDYIVKRHKPKAL